MAQLDFNTLKKQIENAGLSAAAFEAEFNKIKNTGGDVNRVLKTMQATVDGIQDTGQEILGTFTDLSAQLRANLAELGKTNSALSVSKKAYQGITSVVDKLKNEEQGIYDFNVKQLKNLQEKAKVGYDDLRRSVQQLTAEERATEAGRAMLKARRAGYQAEREALVAIEKRLELEKKVEKVIGATGALIEGSSKLLSTMGFGHLSSELSELNDKLKTELREELKKSGDEANKLALSFKYMAKGLAGSAKIFADGLTDPLFIVGKIFDTYLDINKTSVDLQRLTGQNAVAAASINTSYASAKDILETMAELTKQTGMNAQNVFSGKVLSQAAELKTTMGLTAEEAGGIALMAQTSNKSVQDIADSVVATTSAFNSANRSAVSQGQVLRDVANTADSIKLSLGNNDVAIAKAASAARRLGMDLERVDQIAGSLMNFEDSISNELEAELLTGKQLNLEKARELALNNDLAGLSEELFKNSSDIAEFGKMNRIQQESYAAALGMTRDELAKMAYNKAIEAGMTEEQAAAAAKVNAEDMKRVTAQENFAKALEKIAGAVAPILDVVGDILSMPLVPYLLLGAAAAYKIGGGLMSSVKSMGSLAKGALDFAKNIAGKGGAGGSIVGKLTQGVGGTAVESVGEKVAGVADKTKGIGPGAGSGVKSFLTGLGQGLAALGKALANGQVLVGLGALTLAVIGIGFALKLAAPGIEAFGTVVTAAFGGLATLIGAVADGFVKILGAVTMDNISPMLLLGPALFGIAAGLSAVSLAGLLALPAIGGLVLLSKAAPALVSLGIGGENKSAGEAKGKEKEGSIAALEAKFDTLIEIVKQGTTITLDGAKISTSVNRNLPKVQVATS